MQRKSKIAASAVGAAALAGALLFHTFGPCSTPDYAFAGDTVGNACTLVPRRMYFTDAQIFVDSLPTDVVPGSSTTAVCRLNYATVPCWITIDGRKYIVQECLQQTAGGYWVQDPSCKWARQHFN